MSKNNRKYFAAANSFGGFVSFFRKIFNSEDYERIYVIKGGPGTGKSSLMHAVITELQDEADEIEEIYCSSDPHSLDAVIIENNNKRVAIIDGTAPHERDAVIPGVKDEIINLGCNWDGRFLLGYKDEIISLCKEKSKAYITAYSYLSVAGSASDFICGIYKGKFDKKRGKDKAESIFSSIETSKEGLSDIRLISSFGKYGSYNLPFDCDNKITVSDDGFYSNILLNYFADYLVYNDVSFRIFPYALSPKDIDSIYIPHTETAIIKSKNPDVVSEEYFNLSLFDVERTKAARQIYKAAIDEASRWFNIASDLHFRLEEIYSSAMNFEMNNEIVLEKTTEIRNILELSR